MIAVTPGQNILFVSEVSNFPETTTFTYEWQVSDFLSNESQSEDRFAVHVSDEAPPGTTYNVSVSVRGIADTGAVYDASDQLVMVVSESNTYIGESNIINRGLAAVVSLIPEEFRLAVKIFAIILAIGALIYFISRIAAPFSL